MKWRRVTRLEDSRKAGNRQGNRGDRDWERGKGCFCLVAPEIHCSPHQSWRADEIVPAQREPHGSHVQSWHKSCWQGIEVDYIVQINCCLNLPLFLLARRGLGTWAAYCLILIAGFFFFICAGTSPRFLPSQRDHVKNFNLKGKRLRISHGEQFPDVSVPNSRSKWTNLHYFSQKPQQHVQIHTFGEEQTKSNAFATCRSLINAFSLFLDHFPFVWSGQSCRQAWERLSH